MWKVPVSFFFSSFFFHSSFILSLDQPRFRWKFKKKRPALFPFYLFPLCVRLLRRISYIYIFLIPQAIEVAELQDRIHLRTTYYNYAKHLEATGNIPAAIVKLVNNFSLSLTLCHGLHFQWVFIFPFFFLVLRRRILIDLKFLECCWRNLSN